MKDNTRTGIQLTIILLCQEPLCFIHFWRFPFSHFLPLPLLLPSILSLGVIRNGLLWEAGQKGGKLLGQNQLNILKMVQFECPKVIHPLVSSTYESNCRRSLSFVSERRLAPRCTAMLSVESNAVCRSRKQARLLTHRW